MSLQLTRETKQSAGLPVTARGFKRMTEELDYLISVRRNEVSERLREAFDTGGEVPENGDLVDALREKELLEGQIGRLGDRLAGARPIDPAEVRRGVVGVGTRVWVEEPEANSVVRYDIVGTLEANAAARRLSDQSPVGRALLGHRRGDIVEVTAPGGTFALTVRLVEPLEERETRDK